MNSDIVKKRREIIPPGNSLWIAEFSEKTWEGLHLLVAKYLQPTKQ